MKKNKSITSMKTLALASMLLFCINTAHSDNYFTTGVNDTLRISPSQLGEQVTVPVRAHFEGRLNRWSLAITHPGADTLSIVYTSPAAGMNVPYLDSIGQAQVYYAPLTSQNSNTSILSNIEVIGYWDYNNSGHYSPYGPVKWEAGDYQMFLMTITANMHCDGRFITISGYLWSDNDARSGTIGYTTFYRAIRLIVRYKRGDVNGDESFSIVDVNLLIDYLLGSADLDEYQLEAADFNGDGSVSALDVTDMITALNS